jgi:hypothetical protein
MLQPIWYVTGAIAFCLSITFTFLHPNITVKFVLALLSVSTVSVIQKYAVISIESFYLAKKHRHLSLVFDTLFG